MSLDGQPDTKRFHADLGRHARAKEITLVRKKGGVDLTPHQAAGLHTVAHVPNSSIVAELPCIEHTTAPIAAQLKD
jgi:hypothetical protein